MKTYTEFMAENVKDPELMKLIRTPNWAEDPDPMDKSKMSSHSVIHKSGDYSIAMVKIRGKVKYELWMKINLGGHTGDKKRRHNWKQTKISDNINDLVKIAK